MNSNISRRSALGRIAGSSAAIAAAGALAPRLQAAEPAAAPAKLKGNINHSACAWCYNSLIAPGKNEPAKMSFEDFCLACAAMGIQSIDLLGPDRWPAAKKAGLICAMCNGPDSIGYGWNRLDHHDKLMTGFEKAIPDVAAAGFPSIITFSGNRNGMSNEQGLENCVKGLKRLAPIAEKNKVTVCVELLNSKVNHKDYMFDHAAWGVELCKQVGSERIKILYDIYHAQIMEGDLIATIKQYHPYFAHYHTGGVPGRHEINGTQEINYPAVMRAIVDTGYKGYVAQEFIPAGPDPLASLKEAVLICDV